MSTLASRIKGIAIVAIIVAIAYVYLTWRSSKRRAELESEIRSLTLELAKVKGSVPPTDVIQVGEEEEEDDEDDDDVVLVLEEDEEEEDDDDMFEVVSILSDKIKQSEEVAVELPPPPVIEKKKVAEKKVVVAVPEPVAEVEAKSVFEETIAVAAAAEKALSMSDIKRLKLDELKQMAIDKGIDVAGKTTRADFIAVLSPKKELDI